MMRCVKSFGFQLVLLTGLLGSVFLPPAEAATAVKIRAADEGTVGRLIVDWGTAEQFSTEIEGGFLYVRFSKPFEADLGPASIALAKYLGPGEFLEGRQSIRFPLKGDFELASSNNGNEIILELKKPAAAGSAKEGGALRVKLRSGDHKEFSRLVFDWPIKGVGHSSRSSGDDLIITFDKAANIDLGGFNNDPLNFVKGISAVQQDGKTIVTLALAPGSAASSFPNDNSVVFDVRPSGKPEKAEKTPPAVMKVASAPPVVSPVIERLAPPEAKPAPVKSNAEPMVEKKADPAPTEVAAQAPAPQPVKKTPEVTPAPKPHTAITPVTSESGDLDAISPASGSAMVPIGPTIVLDPEPAAEKEPEPVVLAKVEDAPEEVKVKIEPEPAVAPAPVAQDKKMAVQIANLKDGFRLIFPWKRPAAMAMFEEGGAYWVVFDRPIEADFSNLSGPYKFLVSSAKQLENERGTVLRFNFRDGYAPRVSKVNEDWHIDFQLDAKTAVTHPLSMQAQGVSSSGFRLFIPAVNNGQEIRFTDPQSDSELVTTPLHAAGWGIEAPRDFNAISILASIQGIAMKSKDANIEISSEQNGVSIIAISSEYAASEKEQKDIPKMPGEELHPAPAMKDAHLVKLSEWRQVRPVLFTLKKQELQKKVAASPAKEKRAAEMELAKFYVGHEFYADARGVLAEILARYPKMEKDREFRLLLGLSELGLNHYELAANSLYHDDFEGDVEVAPWRAATSAGMGDWERAAQELNYSAPAFDVYDPELQNRFRLLRARAALENVDVNLAKEVLGQIKPPVTKSQKAEKAFLDGMLAFQLSDFPTASAKFSEAVKIGYRPVTEQARFDKINVDLVSKRITPEEAITEMEKLDFAWRGDELEVEIQKRLGDLYVATGQIGNGLETYKRIVRYFPKSPYSSSLGRKMNELFADLFLDGGADKLPPIKALAIYYQYRELTPVGEKGDKMIQILADRLTRVDLLEQAAQLLEHQVNFRLKGLERTNAGTKLAVIHLWNNKPQDALRVLYDTRWRQLSPEAKKERLYIEARAQAGLQHYDEALRLISEDNSEDGDELRAEIYWKSKNWAEAIPAIERLIGNGHSSKAQDFERLDRQRIMQLAVARNLSNDKTGIQRMRKTYREKMVGTPDQAAFDLITEENDPSAAAFRERATVIAKVGQLESFMTGYREKLKNGEFWETY